MPELAEVEFFRKQWQCGAGDRVLRVVAHSGKRVFRRASIDELIALLPGARLTSSEANGKQLLFRFSKDLWLGLHLGMTGKLSAAGPDFRPGPHDHLALFQAKRALVFTDPRLFGCVRFAKAAAPPDWWARLPPPVNSAQFNPGRVNAFLLRHRRLPIKPALLLQSGFPGVGNWMADEILWRARIHPLTPSGTLTDLQRRALWTSLRFVSRQALRSIGETYADPPRGWLFRERWDGGGKCPKHRVPLERQSVRGRTTAWCPVCQVPPVGRPRLMGSRRV